MSKNYGMMMSYKDAISWVESLPDDGKSRKFLTECGTKKTNLTP